MVGICHSGTVPRHHSPCHDQYHHHRHDLHLAHHHHRDHDNHHHPRRLGMGMGGTIHPVYVCELTSAAFRGALAASGVSSKNFQHLFVGSFHPSFF